MPVNNPMTADKIAELKRLWAAATEDKSDNGTARRMQCAFAVMASFPALIAALEAAEALGEAYGVEKAREILSMAESGEEADEMMRKQAAELRRKAGE